MQFLPPDVLEMARGLSVPLCGVGLALGFLLWVTGWWGHRFWIVLVATVTAGVIGLSKGPVLRVQPLVAGLLLAGAVGVLALALVRVVAFAAGGLAAWAAVHALAPASWDEPLVCFLAGGLLGLLLFRWWTMALTSFVATLLMGFFGLLLADRLGKVDAADLATRQRVLLNGAVGVLTLLGFGIQYLLDRRRNRKRFSPDEDEERPGRERRSRYQDEKRPFWGMGRKPYRRAG